MRSPSLLALGFAAALVATAAADEHDPAPATAEPVATGVAGLLAAQLGSATRAHATVEAKLAERTAARAARLRVAYKLLRGAGSPLTVAPERRMAVARSRATARLLLARDRAEETQLADEALLLATAIARIERDRAATPPAAPATLLRPVAGEIVRHAGTLVHERSGAVLARRGIDFEVAAEAPVVAPADGVIRYAGPIRGLDHGVVLEHGGAYTILAKLAPLAYVPGTRVTRGMLVGFASKRRVYLELRLAIGPGGIPVDPEPLLVAPPK